MTYIIRDHDREKFEARKQLLQDIAKNINTEIGFEAVTVRNKGLLLQHGRYYKEGYEGPIEVAKSDGEPGDCPGDSTDSWRYRQGSKISYMGIPYAECVYRL